MANGVTLSAPEPLTADHDVSGFDCCEAALDDWLRRHALANQSRRASRTFVVCEGKPVVGYYSLAAGSMLHAEATGKLRRNMPEPVPMALLGRLAVDRRGQGSGIGAALLKDALVRVIRAADLLGVRGVMVDALTDEARAFYEKFGFRPSPSLPMKLMISLGEAERELAKAQSAP